jgi:hypothetical protein
MLRWPFPLGDDVAVVSEEVIMSKVILDINMSLDGLIAQPERRSGADPRVLLLWQEEHDGIATTAGRSTEGRRGFPDPPGRGTGSIWLAGTDHLERNTSGELSLNPQWPVHTAAPAERSAGAVLLGCHPVG